VVRGAEEIMRRKWLTWSIRYLLGVHFLRIGRILRVKRRKTSSWAEFVRPVMPGGPGVTAAVKVGFREP